MLKHPKYLYTVVGLWRRWGGQDERELLINPKCIKTWASEGQWRTLWIAPRDTDLPTSMVKRHHLQDHVDEADVIIIGHVIIGHEIIVRSQYWPTSIIDLV